MNEIKILVIGDFHGVVPKKLKQITKNIDFILCTGDFGGNIEYLKQVIKNLGKRWRNYSRWKKIKKENKEIYKEGKMVLQELDKIGKPTYIIPGNWDQNSRTAARHGINNPKKYKEIVKKSKNLHWWNRGIKRLEGLKILAFGGKVTAGDYLKNKAFYLKAKEKTT